MTGGPGNSRYLKKFNRQKVLNIIKDHEPISRQELSRVTGLTPPAITGIIRELLALGVVKETGLGKSQGGRKPIKLAFNPYAGYVLGIEISHYETIIGIADLKNQPSDIKTVPLDMTDPYAGIRELGEIIRQTFSEDRYAATKILGAGIAMPGLLNAKTGVIRRSVNLGAGWTNFALREALEREIGMPVVIESNSRASALAEHWFGDGVGCQSLVYVNLGEGISAGIIMGDRILEGTHGYAGQLGHNVVNKNGPLCNCGNRGCLEAICGIPALLRKAASELPLLKKADSLKTIFETTGEVSLKDILLSAGEKDSYAWELLNDMGKQVGLAIASVVNLYNPGKVFLGGKIAPGAGSFIDSVREVVTTHAFPEVAEATEIAISKLGGNAAVIGACALAIRELLQSPDSALFAEIQLEQMKKQCVEVAQSDSAERR